MLLIFENASPLQEKFLRLHFEEHYQASAQMELDRMTEETIQKGYKKEDTAESVIFVVSKSQPNPKTLNIDRLTCRLNTKHFRLEYNGLGETSIDLLGFSSLEKNEIGQQLLEMNQC